jgi:hypothetical protein
VPYFSTIGPSAGGAVVVGGCVVGGCVVGGCVVGGCVVGAGQAAKKGNAANTKARQMLPSITNNVLFFIDKEFPPSLRFYPLKLLCYLIFYLLTLHLLRFPYPFLAKLPDTVQHSTVLINNKVTTQGTRLDLCVFLLGLYVGLFYYNQSDCTVPLAIS